MAKRKQTLTQNRFFSIIFLITLAIFSVSLYAMSVRNEIIVQASVLNIRSGPGLSYDVVGQANQGDQVKLISQQNDWVHVQFPTGETGWVAAWLVEGVELAKTDQFIATTISETSLYADAELTEEVNKVASNEKYQINDYQENAVQIVTKDGSKAWLSKSAIEMTPGVISPSPLTAKHYSISDPTSLLDSNQEPIITIPTDGVNFRTGPSVDSDIMTQVSTGQEFKYIQSEKDFYLVETPAGDQGYVSRNNSVFSDPSLKAKGQESLNTTQLANSHIVIDPGHGGSDPGALGSDFNEEDVTLKTSLLLKEKLEKAGAKVTMTRETDNQDVSLADRASISNQAGADVFISVHFDYYGEAKRQTAVSGTSTYYYKTSDQALAQTINHYLTGLVPLPNHSADVGNFQVLRDNTQPALLLELGYMNNPMDYQRLGDDVYLEEVTDAILYGLSEYFQPAQEEQVAR